MISIHLLEKLACARPKTIWVVVSGCAAFAMVVAADYLTSYELSLNSLYVLVILSVSWFAGAWWGSLFSFMSVFARMQIGLVLGTNFSEAVYFYVSNGNRLFAYLVITLLASSLRTLYERANNAARVDYLTGLSNRMGFHEKVAVELARHRRIGGNLAVAYIDCDHFKVINDGLGHSEGDRVLKIVGETLKSKSRATDIVARLGGDEFAVVYPQISEIEALGAIKKLKQELDSAMTKHDWPITFSIGIGIYPSVPVNVDHVISFSDKLMYRVKAVGKNQVMHRVYNPDEPDTKPPGRLKAV